METNCPLKEKLQKPCWIIDPIVYKLYSLTEEENVTR